MSFFGDRGTTLFPDQCPNEDCGSHHFRASELSYGLATVTSDNGGGIAQIRKDQHEGSTFLSAECVECGEVVIEDGEPVHEVADNE